MEIKINEQNSLMIQDILLGSGDENKELIKAILLLNHPIGCYYWSEYDTDPGTLFGGTWTRVKDKFILAVGDVYQTAGATGGAASVTYTPEGTVGNHTLTTAEIPGHTHGVKTLVGTGPHMAGDEPFVSGIVSHIWNGTGTTREGAYQDAGTVIHQIDATHEHNSVGGSGAHNHGFTGTQATIETVPPFEAAYCWKRTA